MQIRRREGPVRFVASLLLFGLWLRPATAQLLGPEFQVNSYTTGAQHSPSMAADGFGNFVVVWSSYGQDTTGVFAQRFNSAGNKVGNEFQVNTYTTTTQRSPAVATDGSGNFIVTWESYSQDGSSWGVFGQRFNSAGIPVGSEFQVNSYTTGGQYRSGVAADDLGNFVVVWNSLYQDGSDQGVFGQRFNSAGSPVGSEFKINSYTTSIQSSPAVAAVGAGNLVMVWNSYEQDGSLYGVFGQRFDSAGSPEGSEFQVNTYTTSWQRFPRVVAIASGNFVVVWESSRLDGSGEGVFGQRFNSAGSPVESEFQVNTYTTSNQRGPAVAADSSGNFVVAWSSKYQDGSYYSYYGVFGQRFNSVGTPVGSEFQINTYTTGSQANPAVAADGSGNFVVVWNSHPQDGSDWGVFGQRLSNWILIDGFESSDACAWSAAVGGGCP